jgi:hypothetical protein
LTAALTENCTSVGGAFLPFVAFPPLEDPLPLLVVPVPPDPDEPEPPEAALEVRVTSESIGSRESCDMRRATESCEYV